jgi:hypothetical protein
MSAREYFKEVTYHDECHDPDAVMCVGHSGKRYFFKTIDEADKYTKNIISKKQDKLDELLLYIEKISKDNKELGDALELIHDILEDNY